MPTFAALSICHLFNCMIRFGKFPEKLKVARITPLHKQGKPKNDPESYRPISNLNAIEKVIESLLKEQLDYFLENNKIITPNHHGGQRHHSTVTARLNIDTNVHRYRENDKATAILTTDLSATFDTVDSELLMTKL